MVGHRVRLLGGQQADHIHDDPPYGIFVVHICIHSAEYSTGKPERIQNGLYYMTVTSLAVGLLLALICSFDSELLASVFTGGQASIMYAAQYLKGFALDMLVGCTVLMLLGYFNGSGHSKFVMLQGPFSAFCVRIPVVLFLRHERM